MKYRHIRLHRNSKGLFIKINGIKFYIKDYSKSQWSKIVSQFVYSRNKRKPALDKQNARNLIKGSITSTIRGDSIHSEILKNINDQRLALLKESKEDAEYKLKQAKDKTESSIITAQQKALENGVMGALTKVQQSKILTRADPGISKQIRKMTKSESTEKLINLEPESRSRAGFNASFVIGSLRENSRNASRVPIAKVSEEEDPMTSGKSNVSNKSSRPVHPQPFSTGKIQPPKKVYTAAIRKATKPKVSKNTQIVDEQITPDESFVLPNEDVPRKGGKGSGQQMGVYDDEINAIMKPYDDWFLGCYDKDDVDSVIDEIVQKRPRLFSFCYLHNEHWTAVYCDLTNDMELCYYDSYAQAIPKALHKKLKEMCQDLGLPYYLKFKVNNIVMQSEKTSSCALMCISYLIERYLGFSHKSATNFIDIAENEKKMYRFKGNLVRFNYL